MVTRQLTGPNRGSAKVIQPERREAQHSSEDYRGTLFPGIEGPVVSLLPKQPKEGEARTVPGFHHCRANM